MNDTAQIPLQMQQYLLNGAMPTQRRQQYNLTNTLDQQIIIVAPSPSPPPIDRKLKKKMKEKREFSNSLKQSTTTNSMREQYEL